MTAACAVYVAVVWLFTLAICRAAARGDEMMRKINQLYIKNGDNNENQR